MPAKVDASYSCATLRYVVDAARDISVPVGVALWNRERNWLRLRFPKEGERIEGIQAAEVTPYLEAARAQIEGWLRRDTLPYAREPLFPLSDGWWDQVRRLMQFSVRAGPVQPVDCRNPEEEIEGLFDALVQPQVSQRTKSTRIDGAVRRVLGPLVARFQRGRKVAGFGGRLVEVLRGVEDERRTVVLEAVNLAARTAERDADALTSRLCRIKEGNAERETRFVLGYLASPGGLNGEAVLKEWVEHQVGAQMYDLDREGELFQQMAREATEELGDRLGLYPALPTGTKPG